MAPMTNQQSWRGEASGDLPPRAIGNGGYNGFKVAIAVIVFYFGVKMLVQFADILLPFIMALLLVTVLEPLKLVTFTLLEATLLLLFAHMPLVFSCCLQKPLAARPASPRRAELREAIKRFLLLISILLTLSVTIRCLWIVSRIVWLSGEAVRQDFVFYQQGVSKRQEQVKGLLQKYGLANKAHVDMEDLANVALSTLKYAAEFLTQHVFYTVSQVCLTTIFALFLLYSPVQRDFSQVMHGVFSSMEVYLKLKSLVSVLMGITNGCALAVIGIELPAAWGLLTVLANFVPNIGGPVMSILPCVIALLDVRKSLSQVLVAFLAQFFLHFTIANFVEPVIFGTTEKIHSVVVLLGLSFFGYIWGITGMFLSVPLMFAVHAWLDTVARTSTHSTEAREDARFVMGMLEGRWLADASGDSAEDDPHIGVNLLEGHIEFGGEAISGTNSYPLTAFESPTTPRRFDKTRSGHTAEAEKGWVLMEVNAIFAINDAASGEIRPAGVLLRWLALSTAYALAFFGFSIFGFDLQMLIHPSGGSYVGEVASESTLPLDIYNATIARAAMVNATRGLVHKLVDLSDHQAL